MLIRPARFADAVQLAPGLRLEDALELFAAWPVPADAGLMYCLLDSDRAFAIEEGGRTLALWGVASGLAGGLELGVPWLLAAPGLFRRKRELVVRSRRWIDRLLLDYDALTNLTDAGNVSHLRWLDRCGFRWLRDHAAHGRLGRTYREFYRVNARRHSTDVAVRELLLARAAPAPAGIAAPLARAVLLACGLFADRGRAAAVLDELPGLLLDLEGATLRPRMRRGAVTLLGELATVLAAAETAPSPLAAGSPARAWCRALLEVAEVLALGPVAAPAADVVMALDGHRPGAERVPPGPGSPAAVGAPAGPNAGAVLLQRLAVGYLRALTLNGRLDPASGYRVRRAAAGLDDGPGESPPGIPRSDLVRAFSTYRIAAAAVGGTGPMPFIDLGEPVPGCLDRLREALPPGSEPARALAGTVDRWGPHVRSARTVADTCRIAGAMADAVAERLLPVVRLGGVSVGQAERLALYRVLRAQLLYRAMGGDRRRLCGLLAAEVAALLVAAAFDDALLSLPVPGSFAGGAGRMANGGADADAALTRAVAALWGPVGAADLPALLMLLLPLLTAPAVHGCQLAPALLVWHLAETDELGGLLEALDDVLRRWQREPRQRCFRVLRRWQRGLDIVALQRHLNGHGNYGSARPDGADPGAALP